MPDDYYVSKYSGEEIDERLTAAHNAVRYDAAQSLTDAQKAQARGNIGAGSSEELAKKPDALFTYATLHVAKTGSDTTGDGSENKPYLTIQKALNSLPRLLLSRATINIHEGVYDENVFISYFLGYEQIVLNGISGETVKIKTINANICSVKLIFKNFELFGASQDEYKWSLQCSWVPNMRIENIRCIESVASSSYGAFRFDECGIVRIYNTEISNKAIALDVAASVVYLNNTVTGTNNTVGIRCGSGYGSSGGYVQKGGATINGEEQKGYSGQIW